MFISHAIGLVQTIKKQSVEFTEQKARWIAILRDYFKDSYFRQVTTCENHFDELGT